MRIFLASVAGVCTFAAVYLCLRTCLARTPRHAWQRQVLALHRPGAAEAGDPVADNLRPWLELAAGYVPALGSLNQLDEQLRLLGYPLGLRKAVHLYLLSAGLFLLAAISFWPDAFLHPGFGTFRNALLYPPAFGALPTIAVRGALRSREQEMLKDLPRLIRLLSIHIRSAGLPYLRALAEAERGLPDGPLKSEVARLNRALEVDPDLQKAFHQAYDRIGVLTVRVILQSGLTHYLHGASPAEVADLFDRQAALLTDLQRSARQARIRTQAAYATLVPIGLGLVVLVLMGYPIFLRFANLFSN